MTAQTADRSTPIRDGRIIRARVHNSTKFYAGSLLEISAAGYVSKAKKAAGKTYWGIAQQGADTDSAGSDVVETRHGATAHFFGDATLDTDAEKLAALGDDAYVIDDQTVSTTSTSATKCGVIVDFDSDGVWVKLDR